ncbi:hypothetical protein Lal_00012603 [Lupinus albus]|nr:hypothetical protein Lal_00012603 [Lupinus albus]
MQHSSIYTSHTSNSGVCAFLSNLSSCFPKSNQKPLSYLIAIFSSLLFCLFYFNQLPYFLSLRFPLQITTFFFCARRASPMVRLLFSDTISNNGNSLSVCGIRIRLRVSTPLTPLSGRVWCTRPPFLHVMLIVLEGGLAQGPCFVEWNGDSCLCGIRLLTDERCSLKVNKLVFCFILV